VQAGSIDHVVLTGDLRMRFHVLTIRFYQKDARTCAVSGLQVGVTYHANECYLNRKYKGNSDLLGHFVKSLSRFLLHKGIRRCSMWWRTHLEMFALMSLPSRFSSLPGRPIKCGLRYLYWSSLSSLKADKNKKPASYNSTIIIAATDGKKVDTILKQC
jgi:hypothetical protein